MPYAIEQTDSYKLSHHGFMTDGTEVIYSNLTPRSSYYLPVVREFYDEVMVWYGIQFFINDYLIKEWNETFFDLPIEEAVPHAKELFDDYLGQDAIPDAHIRELHDLGYLPIRIKALPEGSLVPIKVAPLTIVNTHPRFGWLTNYLETVKSSELWKPSTVATIIREFRKLVNRWALKTTGSTDGTEFQVHDFSFRGMSGRRDAAICGSAFLLSSCGTDTVPAIRFLMENYGADPKKELIGTSVPASEHSLASTGIAVNGELETYRKWITKDYPTGIVSIVSDTLDFFEVITTMARDLKDDILARQVNELGLAKVVFRPDSGCPIKILTGYKVDSPENAWAGSEAVQFEDGVYTIKETNENRHGFEKDKQLSEAEIKGAVECLWEIFGGSKTETGYKLLHERVGLIYGDSITLERGEAICSRLAEKGFASTNVILGVGSFTSQYITRDSLGIAVKATYAKVNGTGYELFKDPKTDDGTKKSAKGLLRVEHEDGKYVMYDQQTEEQEKQGCLTTVFEDGKLTRTTTLSEIRSRLWG